MAPVVVVNGFSNYRGASRSARTSAYSASTLSSIQASADDVVHQRFAVETVLTLAIRPKSIAIESACHAPDSTHNSKTGGSTLFSKKNPRK